MDFAEFQRRAGLVWEEIPDVYRPGVDGLVLEEEALPHPTMPDIYTLGECRTESYPSDWGGPDTTRSVLVLFYGSFQRLSELDPEFDWRYEIWETITHELRHHLEWLALEDALEDVDYAVDENFKRLNDEPFDPYFFRSGEQVAPGVYEAERDVFVEVEYDGTRGPEPWLEFTWQGDPYEVRVPEELGDLTFVQITGGVETGSAEVCVVLVRRRGLLERLRSWLRRAPLSVMEAGATARRRS